MLVWGGRPVQLPGGRAGGAYRPPMSPPPLAAAAALVAVLALAAYLAAAPRRPEAYGPPPGMVRARAVHELGSRGWADALYCNPARAATTASAMMGYVRLSAN